MPGRTPQRQPRTDGKPRLAGRKAGEAAGMNDVIRAEIVHRLAEYESPTAIWRDLLARGIDISIQAVGQYNPERFNYSHGTKWLQVFTEARRAWLDRIATEPMARREFRLEKLRLLMEEAIERRELTQAASFLEQAAKEMGDVYTKIQNSSGAVLTLTAPPETMSTAECRNLLTDRLREAIMSRREFQSLPPANEPKLG